MNDEPTPLPQNEQDFRRALRAACKQATIDGVNVMDLLGHMADMAGLMVCRLDFTSGHAACSVFHGGMVEAMDSYREKEANEPHDPATCPACNAGRTVQ